MIKISVITVSDRAFRGEYEDRSGPRIVELLKKSGLELEITQSIVPDDKGMLKKELEWNLGKDYVITTGGTGISPRDITPEVTGEVCDYSLPGISEMLRAESLKETKNAVFSRGYSGIRGNTVIINFPGSVKAVTLCTNLIIPVLEHGVRMLRGEKH